MYKLINEITNQESMVKSKAYAIKLAKIRAYKLKGVVVVDKVNKIVFIKRK